MAHSLARCRVAFILPSFAGGGAERVMIGLAGALPAASFASEIIVLNGEGPWRGLVPAHVPVTDLRRKRIRAALLPLVRRLRTARFDAAISTIGSLNLALLALKPLLPRTTRLYVREANTPHRHARGRAGMAFYRWAYPRLYRRAAAVIVPASYLARELAEDFGVPAETIVVLRNPVDTAALRAGAEPPLRVAGPGLRFVAVGRLTHQKGFDRLMQAMAASPADAQLTIFGEGPDRAALEAQRAALGLDARVAMPGFDGSAPRHVAGADALLLPSRWEGMPNVALEALALGTKVIATPEAGGIGEIAAAAPAGAVTLAAAGRAFTAAMARTTAAAAPSIRASLLPDAFGLETAAGCLAKLLEAHRRPSPDGDLRRST